MPGQVSASYERKDHQPTYFQIVAFGSVLVDAADFDAKMLLDYFQSPHKWRCEYLTWQEIGGRFDDETLIYMRERFEANDFGE